jgi:transcriptional regulator with XRE-family HTH domain
LQAQLGGIQDLKQMNSKENSIAARLQQVRSNNHLNQKEFSEMLGVSLRAYQNYERGDSSISVECVLALNQAFGINPRWLLTGSGMMLITENEHVEELDGARGLTYPLYPELAEKIAISTFQAYGARYNSLSVEHKKGIFSTIYSALCMLGTDNEHMPSDEDVKLLIDLSIKLHKLPAPSPS